MSLNLFVDDLTASDPVGLQQAIVNFAQTGIEEKFRLDFKEKWEPDKQCPDIVAFANSYGGLLILGDRLVIERQVGEDSSFSGFVLGLARQLQTLEIEIDRPPRLALFGGQRTQVGERHSLHSLGTDFPGPAHGLLVKRFGLFGLALALEVQTGEIERP